MKSDKSSTLIIVATGVYLLANASAAYADLTSAYPTYDDREIREAVCTLMMFQTGAYGMLITTASGIGAILSAAFGAYRAFVSLLVTALSCFILPAMVSLWFGEISCEGVGNLALPIISIPLDNPYGGNFPNVLIGP